MEATLMYGKYGVSLAAAVLVAGCLRLFSDGTAGETYP
jgi:hypothetical protein